METNGFYIEIEKNFVKLMQNSEYKGGVSPLALNADVNEIKKAYETIIKKYDFTSKYIQRLIDLMFQQLKVFNFAQQILSFCYWCNYIDEQGGINVKSLIENVKRGKSADEIIHDIFVSEIASKYVNAYSVELKVKKTEKGVDLIINNLKCECKIRLGYLDRNNPDNIFSYKVKLLNKLAEKEAIKIIRNRVIHAFFTQGANVVFVDVKRTNLGYFEFAKDVFKISAPLTKAPELKTYMIIFYSKLNGREYWQHIWIEP